MLPNTDFEDLIVVHFIGGKLKWETMMPQLEGSRDHVLVMRPAVVFSWIARLKETHPAYKDVPLVGLETAAAEMTTSYRKMLAAAMVVDDGGGAAEQEAELDNAEESNVAQDGVQAGFSDVVIDNQCAKTTEASKKRAVFKTLGIDSRAAPENEFDDNEGLLASAFPWVFMFGKVGLAPGGGVNMELRRRLLLQYDRRAEREPALIFLLFNQMQRHRASQNIVTAPHGEIEKINALAALPNFEEVVNEAFSDRPTDDGKEVRKTIMRALQVGEETVPFSRSEMDYAFTVMVGMTRWFGCPLVFLTVTPLAINSAFALKLCAFGEEIDMASYDERSRAVLLSPAMSSMYFKIIIDFILEEVVCIPERSSKKTIPDDPDARIGIFGQCVAEAHTVEVQGRTALHAHMLIWSKISPEFIQQCERKGLVEKMRQIRDFIERILVTKMDADFWEASDAVWNDKTPGKVHAKMDPPGLNETLSEKQRYWHNVHNCQCHRQHKATCFKKGPGGGKLAKGQFDLKGRCRMAMPAGLWDKPSQMIGLKYDDDVKVVTPMLNVPPWLIKCTHVFECDCQEIEDVGGDAFFPLVFELNRPKPRDALIAGFTPEILDITCANSSTTIISSVLQGGPIILYLIKYNTKAKMTIANARSSALAAFDKFSKTTEKTEKTIFNQIVNAFSAGQEVPATMAAYALLGGSGFSCTVNAWYIFPHDAMGKARTDAVRSSTMRDRPPEDDDDDYADYYGDGDDSDDEEADEIAMRENDIHNEAAFVDCTVSGRVFKVDEERFSIKQDEIYIHRPKQLETCCFLSFCLMFDVVPALEERAAPERTDRGKQSGRKPQPRFEFVAGFPLRGHFELVLRAKFPIPILAGGSPPPCPLSRRSHTAAGCREVWAFYWTTLLTHWRSADECMTNTFRNFTNNWFLPALRGELGKTEREKALYVTNITFNMKVDAKGNRAMQIWRMRGAGTEEQWRRERQMRGENVEPHDAAVSAESGGLCDDSVSVLRLLAMTESERHDTLVNDIFLGGAAQENTRGQRCPQSTVRCDPPRVAELIKEISSYEPAPPRRPVQERAAPVGSAVPENALPVVVPPAGLNKDQASVFTRVISSIHAGNQELLFVQGEAGTGKSFLIRHIATAAAAIGGPNCVRCLSPTGVAAENLLPGSFTIHRGLGVNVRNIKGELSHAERAAFTERYSGTVVFVIDEISMVQPDLLAVIDARLRDLADSATLSHAARFGLDRQKHFGGHTVVAMGDFYQIPPVTGQTLLKNSIDPGKRGVVAANIWRQFSLVVLHEQMRAQDPAQEERIKVLRSGRVTQALIDSIAEMGSDEAAGWAEAVYIVLTNRERHYLNERLAVAFARKHGVPVIKWRKQIGGGKSKKLGPAETSALYRLAPQLVATFVLGAPAMITQNINPSLGLSNGSDAVLAGIVCSNVRDTALVDGAGPGEVVWLEEPPKHVYANVVALAVSSDAIDFPVVNGDFAVPLEVRTEEEVVKIGNKQETFNARSHCIDIAFAVTVFKVQGKTLRKAVICLGSESDRRAYSFEMLLVAITRVRRACDLRWFPGTSKRRMASLTNLGPSIYTTAWFDGKMFNEHGQRSYADAVALNLEGAAVPAKRQRQQRPRVAAGTPTQSPEKKDARFEPDAGPVATQAFGAIINAFVAHAQNNHIAGPVVGGFVQEILARGVYINETVIGVAVLVLRGMFRDGEVFLDRNELQHCVRRAWDAFAPNSENSYNSYIYFANHFVAIRADSITRRLLVRDSLRTVGAANAEAKAAALEMPRQFCMRLWGQDNVVPFEVDTPQQSESECAIETINNILRAAVGVGCPNFSRATLGECFRQLL